MIPINVVPPAKDVIAITLRMSIAPIVLAAATLIIAS
jgi:hypothetical protein